LRLRICRRPRGSIAGVAIDQFQVGVIYEISTQLGSILLAEGCAERVVVDDSAMAASEGSVARLNEVVLVVEDDLNLRQLTADVLTCHGYDVVLAQHGLEALERLSERSPDLVLLDLQMPVMDGWQFRAEQQRLEEPGLANIPVLLLTAADRAHEHAATLNAVGVIEKPFDPERLLSAVRTALRVA
jgi:CheY-like chemotaxis protein